MRSVSRSSPNAPRIAGPLLALLALFAPPLAAQNLTLNVPSRGGGSSQTAATTIEFDAAAIAGGATVTVDGKVLAVAAPGCVGNACKSTDSTAGGDDLVLTRISGTQLVQLQITYLSVFGANFCAPSIGPAGISFPVSLSGFTFGAGHGYRITSFMSPSDVSCDIPYARVPTSRPSLSGDPLTKLGRLPLNLVLVIDKSPSMAWTIPGSPDIRWDRLKSSVQLFAAVWDAVGAPPPPATQSSEGNANDRLGMVLFGGSAVDASIGGGTFFKLRGADVAPWSAPVTAALADDSFIGGTSVGAGSAQGLTQLNTVKQLTGDTAMVVFTDGEQNTPPCIIRKDEVLSPTSKPYPGQPGVTYLDQCTVAAAEPEAKELMLNGAVLGQTAPRGPVFTIGLGEGGMAASAQLLEEISKETAGTASFPNNGVAMDTSFVDGLVNNLKGGTVSLMDRAIATLPAGTAAAAPMTFIVDPSLSRATFVLSWEGNAREAGLEIRDPDGHLVTPAHASGGPNFRVATVNLPSQGRAGDWKVTVRRFGGSDAFKYQLSAYGVETMLGSRVTESPRLSTGAPIKIVAEIGWDNGVLADLPPGAVRAVIERPGQNLGNIMFEAAQQPIRDKPRSDTSPLAMKFDQLIKEGLLDKIEPRATSKGIELKHVGNGRYEGSFGETKIGGRYRIRVDFEWTDKRTGQIRRREYVERQVPVLPGAQSTTVEVTRDRKTGDALILVTPRDSFGNYVGPGHERDFSVVVGKGEIAGPPSDENLSGQYRIRITGLRPDDDPKVRIVFDGEVLRDGALTTLTKPGGGDGSTGPQTPGEPKPWWQRWWWVILILVLLLLFLLRRK
jgi:hypothetical protein